MATLLVHYKIFLQKFAISSKDGMNFIINLFYNAPITITSGALRFAPVSLSGSACPSFVTLYGIEFVYSTPPVFSGSFLNLAYLLWT